MPSNRFNPYAQSSFQQGSYFSLAEIQARETQALIFRALDTENLKLRNQLARQDLAETAHTEIFQFRDSRLYTRGRNGAPRVLLNHTIREAIHFTPQPPSKQPPCFLVVFDGVTAPLVISEEDFFKDSRLLFAFQEHPGLEVTPRRSQKLTAMLLRQAIAQRLVALPLTPYAGWCADNGEAHFSVFPGGTTHRPKESYEAAQPIAPCTASEAAIAAERFWPTFNVTKDLFARHLIVLWFHTAALSSLLEQLGHPIPMALCCFATDPDQRTYLKRLFGWYQDAPLLLDMRPADFTDELLARRDQPLLVEDAGRLNRSAANVHTLEEALTTGFVSWRSGRETMALPIYAPITIISARASELSCALDVCNLDLSSDSFDYDVWLQLSGHIPDNDEYLRAFIGYVESHLADLQIALDLGQENALRKSRGRLSEKAVSAFGTLLGVATFLADFFKFCSPANPPIEDPLNDLLLLDLFDRLERMSDKEQLADLSDVFLAVARQQLQEGILKTCHRHNCSPSQEENLVIYDEECLHFTPSAFRCVCAALCQSHPTILNALANADLFRGRQINKATAQSLISAWNQQGERHSVAVYSIVRDAFDVLGDPLILEGRDF